MQCLTEGHPNSAPGSRLCVDLGERCQLTDFAAELEEERAGLAAPCWPQPGQQPAASNWKLTGSPQLPNELAAWWRQEKIADLGTTGLLLTTEVLPPCRLTLLLLSLSYGSPSHSPPGSLPGSLTLLSFPCHVLGVASSSVRGNHLCAKWLVFLLPVFPSPVSPERILS